MEKANVNWLGYTPEQKIDIKDPTPGQKIAKAVDDYMNNETEEVILPEDEEYDSLEDALTSWFGTGAPQSRTPFSLVRARTRIPLAV